MNSKKSAIIFLGLMLLILAPWQGFCSTHLFNPTHHDHSDGPSICELRKNYSGDEAILWPPMECKSETMISDSFERPSNELLKISSETAFLATLIFNQIYLPDFTEPVQDSEILYPNLAPPQGIQPLRGPPSPEYIV